MADSYIKIAGRLKSSAKDGVAVEADKVLDTTQGKSQTDVNTEALDAQILETTEVGKSNWVVKEETTLVLDEDDFYSLDDCDEDVLESFVNDFVSRGYITLYKEDGTAYNLPYDATYSEALEDDLGTVYMFSNHSGDYDEDRLAYPYEVSIMISIYSKEKDISLMSGVEGSYDDIDKLILKPICMPTTYEDKTLVRSKYAPYVEITEQSYYKGECNLCSHTFEIPANTTTLYLKNADVSAEVLEQWLVFKSNVKGKTLYVTDNNGNAVEFASTSTSSAYFKYEDDACSIILRITATATSTYIMQAKFTITDSTKLTFTSFTIDDRYIAADSLSEAVLLDKYKDILATQSELETTNAEVKSIIESRAYKVDGDLCQMFLSNKNTDGTYAFGLYIYFLVYGKSTSSDHYLHTLAMLSMDSFTLVVVDSDETQTEKTFTFDSVDNFTSNESGRQFYINYKDSDGDTVSFEYSELAWYKANDSSYANVKEDEGIIHFSTTLAANEGDKVYYKPADDLLINTTTRVNGLGYYYMQMFQSRVEKWKRQLGWYASKVSYDSENKRLTLNF